MTTATVGITDIPAIFAMAGVTPVPAPASARTTHLEGDAFVVAVFEEHGRGVIDLTHDPQSRPAARRE